MSKTFKVTSGFIVASDPCYEIPTWCQGIVPAKNGEWEVYVEIDDYDGRVKNISAWNIEAAQDNHHLPNEVYSAGFLPHSFGVDSGQFGYFDKDAYRNDAVITPDIPTWKEYDTNHTKDETGEKFYSACCEATLTKNTDTEGYGVLPFGLVSRSGWGDGSYPTTGIQDKDGNYIALATVFIDDSYDDDEEEDDDDYTEEEDFDDDEDK